MKHLDEFESWADNIINEYKAPNKKTKAPVAGERDIARQSQTKYAGYDKDQALELFISDKLEDMEKRDLEQNKVINAQRRENDKLRKELSTLGQEVQDTVDTSQRDHEEIERLRALSGQLKGDTETRRASRDEVEAALQQIEQLKTKQGVERIDPQKLKELDAALKNATKNSEEFSKFKEMIDKLNSMKSFDTREYDKLFKEFEEYRNKMEKSWKTRQKWGMTRLGNFDKKIKELETETQDVGDELDKVSTDLENEKTINKLQDKWLRYLNAELERARRAVRDPNIDKYSHQNPYANTSDEEDVTQSPPPPSSDSNSQNKKNYYPGYEDHLTYSGAYSQRKAEKGVQDKNKKLDWSDLNENKLFDSQLSTMIDDVLGPQYSKYLK